MLCQKEVSVYLILILLNLIVFCKSEKNETKKGNYTSEEELRQAAKKLPTELSFDKYNGESGIIGVMGGSNESFEAPCFAAIAALYSGADSAHIFCREEAGIRIKSYLPDLIVSPLLDAEHGMILTTFKMKELDALVIGPGLGDNFYACNCAKYIIRYIKESKTRSTQISVVFVGNAIDLLTSDTELLENYNAPFYIILNTDQLKNLADVYCKENPIDFGNDGSLQELVTIMNPNAILIIKSENDKIITANSTYICTTPRSSSPCHGEDDVLSGLLGLFAYWARFNLDRIKRVNDIIPTEVIAGYAACSVLRLSCNKNFHDKGLGKNTSDILTQINKANEEFFS